MAARRKGRLAQRVRELEEALSRLFSGEGPAPKPARGRKTKRTRRAAKATRKMLAARKGTGPAVGAAKETAAKARRKVRRKARRR
jgi:hypothetical protein